MLIDWLKNTHRSFGAFVACLLALVLAIGSIPLSNAYAYYSFGTVGVYAGSYSLSVQAGSSTQTSITVDPSSDSQTLGCGMAKCPQVCTSDGAVSAGYTCFDVNGQCTCAGTSYSTYYPEVSVQSSNSGVATAYVSGNTLVVTGHSAGSAVITVSASLRQWESNSTSVTVDVSEPASSGGSSGSDSADASATSSGSGSTSASSNASNAAIPQAAEVTDSRDDALNETVVETVAGKVYVVEKNSFLNTADELGKIVDTSDQVVIWAGSSSDMPNYSWTFVGTDVDASSVKTAFDPTITVSKLGTGDVSNIMKQAKDGLVMEFAYSGNLPGTASVYVKTSGTFADGTELYLYMFNEEERLFELAQSDAIKVDGGYASFKIDHCSSWVLSTDDLTQYRVEETNTPGAIAVDKQDSIGENTMPAWVVPVVACVLLVVVVAACVLLVARRRKARAVSQVNELNEEYDLQNRKTIEQEDGKEAECVKEAPCARAEDTSNEHGQE
jgi:hypothetical protein